MEGSLMHCSPHLPSSFTSLPQATLEEGLSRERCLHRSLAPQPVSAIQCHWLTCSEDGNPSFDQFSSELLHEWRVPNDQVMFEQRWTPTQANTGPRRSSSSDGHHFAGGSSCGTKMMSTFSSASNVCNGSSKCE